jgi:HPt (histidine-containing phosphotransfer) domain-containing protein
MPPLDPDAIAQLLEDLPPAAFGAVVVTFERDVARLLDALESAAASGEALAFRRLAHTLAGAAGAVAARPLEATARQGMQAADAAACMALLPSLRSEAQAATAALHALATRP